MGKTLMYRDRIISAEHIRIQIIFSQIIINFFFVFTNILGHILELLTQPHGTLQRPIAYSRLCFDTVAKSYLFCLRAMGVSATLFKVSLDFIPVSPLNLMISHAT